MFLPPEDLWLVEGKRDTPLLKRESELYFLSVNVKEGNFSGAIH